MISLFHVFTFILLVISTEAQDIRCEARSTPPYDIFWGNFLLHNVACLSGEYLNMFKMQQQGKSRQAYQYHYSCCKTNLLSNCEQLTSNDDEGAIYYFICPESKVLTEFHLIDDFKTRRFNFTCCSAPTSECTYSDSIDDVADFPMEYVKCSNSRALSTFTIHNELHGLRYSYGCCTLSNETTRRPITGKNVEILFACQTTGDLIAFQRKCDGYVDCADGSDELDC